MGHDDRALRAGRPSTTGGWPLPRRAARDVQPGRGARGRRRPRRRAGLGAGRRDRRGRPARRRAGRARRPPRLGLRRPRRGGRARPRAALARPERLAGAGRRRARSPRRRSSRVDGGLLYLDRYWREEGQVCADLLARAGSRRPPVDADAARCRRGADLPRGVRRAARRRPGAPPASGPPCSPAAPAPARPPPSPACWRCSPSRPGPGSPPRVALTAPTGKAAARLQEAVARAAAGAARRGPGARGPARRASTLHRLLGSRPDSRTRFRHHRGNRLPHDVVVVDETSMVSLTMMARLLEAVRPDARLVLVGDPDQLASVEAGAVLADLVAGLGAPTTRRSRRCGPPTGSARGSARWPRPSATATPTGPGACLTARAATRSSSSTRTTPRCARRGPRRCRCPRRWRSGRPPSPATRPPRSRRWTGTGCCAPTARARTARRTGTARSSAGSARPSAHRWARRGAREWYAGRPLLVTANDYGLGLYNGDTGVVVRDGGRPARGDRRRRHPPDARDLPAGRGRDPARDDGPQEPGQPGRRRSPCCSRRRTPGC